jgi:hypothetical protein
LEPRKSSTRERMGIVTPVVTAAARRNHFKMGMLLSLAVA